MTVTVSDPVNRFVPELVLGVEHLHSEDRRELVEYLAAVAEARDTVLHPNVAWNALFYGWDPVERTFAAQSVLDELVEVRHGARCDPVPVGALVWVDAGPESVWGEVIYKEGRHPDVDAYGDLPAEVSGSAAAVVDGVAVVREALVVDFDALVPMPGLAPRLERWVRHARHLDACGHLVVDACYTPDDAEVDDVTFYARWLWRHRRDTLAAGWFRPFAGDDDGLWAALVGSLSSVDALLDEVPGLASWGPYRYREVGYRERLGDLDAVLGSADAGPITSRLASVDRGQRVSYRALRPVLAGLAGAGDAQLAGCEYPVTVCHANRLVADTLAERAPDGVLTKAGERLHLRLDDQWQSAGVWRSERLDDIVCPLLAIEVTEPLGLGASGEAADRHEAPAVDPARPEHDEPEPVPEVAEVADSHLHWCVALSRRAHAEGTLRLIPRAGLTAGPDGAVVLRLAHDGAIDDSERTQRVRLDDDGRHLSGVGWPFDFFPGIRLWCVSAPGAGVVHAMTGPLAEPVEVAGVEYGFALDPTVLDPQRPPVREPSLEDLAVRVLRRHGAPTDDGLVALDTADLGRCLFGPKVAPELDAAFGDALGRAHASGRVRRLGDGRWAVTPARQGRRRPASGFFAGADSPSVQATRHLAAQVRRAHWVPLHLRRLVVSERVEPDRRARYRQLRAQAPNRHQLPPELPDGFTFVIGHRRGR